MEFFTKSRVETFCDGIFAIIVTLLVLEIKVPHVEHAESFADLFPLLLDFSENLKKPVVINPNHADN